MDNLTRREFNSLVVGGLVAVPSGLRAFQAPKGTVAGVQLGAQSYSFRDRSLDDCIAGLVKAGLGFCELWQDHVEPKKANGEDGAKHRERLRAWRLSVPLDEFTKIGQKFADAGVAADRLQPELRRRLHRRRDSTRVRDGARDGRQSDHRVVHAVGRPPPRSRREGIRHHGRPAQPLEGRAERVRHARRLRCGNQGHVESDCHQPRHRTLHGGQLRRPRLSRQASRSDRLAAHQGSPSGSGAVCSVRRG